jgi:hypothetical protein
MKHISGILLFFTAVFLALIIMPVGFVYGIIKNILLFKGKTLILVINSIFYAIAYAIDQLGNVVCQFLFNDLMIKKDGTKFGNPDKTISYVLGINKQNNSLSGFGALIVAVLHCIDPYHVEKAVQQDQNND